jgi:hypothetical protein
MCATSIKAQVFVNQNLADFTMDAYLDQEISCRFNADGYIQINNTPAGQYEYFLKKGKDTFYNQHGTFKNLKPGVYKVWSKNILGVTKTTTIKVTTPLKLSAKLIPLVKPTGNNADGILLADIKGGTQQAQPMLVTWYKHVGDSTLIHLNPNPNDNFATQMENLTAGYYTVVLEDDHGCFYTKKYLLRR